LAANAAGGEKLSFVEAPTYDALEVLKPASFDMVFTGIGAICWLPSIKQWAEVVAGLLKPGGRFFIREAHPILWSLDEKITTDLAIRYAYFETTEPMMFQDNSTYMKLADDWKTFENATTLEWNHGIGEIIQALLDVGMEITGMVEHKSLPWEALPGQMVEGELGES
jgi:SAM-dependent methyltransferase